MSEEDRIVVISDATYTNAVTGEVTQSNVYHLPGFGCLADSPHKVEVPERLAKQFGRRLCRTCVNIAKREKARTVIDQLVRDLTDEGLSDFATIMPPHVEVRLPAN